MPSHRTRLPNPTRDDPAAERPPGRPLGLALLGGQLASSLGHAALVVLGASAALVAASRTAPVSEARMAHVRLTLAERDRPRTPAPVVPGAADATDAPALDRCDDIPWRGLAHRLSSLGEGDSVSDALGLGGASVGAYGGGSGHRAGWRRERALRAARDWLARHQRPDGGWGAAEWPARCGSVPCRARPGAPYRDAHERGDPFWELAVDALAALALLGSEPHRAPARAAVEHLIRRQAPDGSIGRAPWLVGCSVQSTAFAIRALARARRLGVHPGARAPLERAVGFALAARGPTGGWAPGVNPEATGWFVLALREARAAGVAVPPAALGQGGAIVEQHALDGDDPALIALARVVAPVAGRACPPELASARPDPSHPSFHAWYLGALAARGDSAWREALMRALLPAQRLGRGCARGSWDPVGPRCGAGGRVWATAFGALALAAVDGDHRADGPSPQEESQ